MAIIIVLDYIQPKLLSYALSLYLSLSSLLFSVIFVLTFSTAKAMLAGKGIARQVFRCVFLIAFHCLSFYYFNDKFAFFFSI